MRRWMLPTLLACALARPAPAEDPPALPDQLPAPIAEPTAQTPQVPADIPLEPSAGCAAPCVKHRTEHKLFWVENEFIGPVQKHVLRDLETRDCRTTLALDWTEEKIFRTEYALKPRECIKEVTTCTVKPEIVVDPCTGCKTTVLQPVTEMKLVKEITYEVCPEEKIYTVRRPFLKPVEEIVRIKRYHLECETSIEKRKIVRPVLVPAEITERVVVPPPPPCAPTPAPAPAATPAAPQP